MYIIKGIMSEKRDSVIRDIFMAALEWNVFGEVRKGSTCEEENGKEGLSDSRV